jgi:hypothetical protein
MKQKTNNRYRDFVQATTPFEESSEEEEITQFLRLFEAYIGTYSAVSDWNLENGIGYWSYEEAEGNQAISWKSGGYANVFNLLKVINGVLRNIDTHDPLNLKNIFRNHTNKNRFQSIKRFF